MQLLGIIGDPISHSLSPIMHTAALKQLNLAYSYSPIQVPVASLDCVMNSLRIFPFKGINITIPHKQTAIKYLDKLAPCAAAVKAVNTVIKQDNSLIGYNTDSTGFLAGLVPYLDKLATKKALIIGAGGAACAVVAALRPYSISLTVSARQFSKFPYLSAVTPAPWPITPELIATHKLIINTTPIGMTGYSIQTWLPNPSGLTPDHICYDLIYTPLETAFLASAKQAGAIIINGLSMFVGQGEQAFYYFTGQQAPPTIMQAAALAALSQRNLDSQ